MRNSVELIDQTEVLKNYKINATHFAGNKSLKRIAKNQ
jgi:hypothetical protein